jgi:hypothetical protein
MTSQELQNRVGKNHVFFLTKKNPVFSVFCLKFNFKHITLSCLVANVNLYLMITYSILDGEVGRGERISPRTSPKPNLVI